MCDIEFISNLYSFIACGAIFKLVNNEVEVLIKKSVSSESKLKVITFTKEYNNKLYKLLSLNNNILNSYTLIYKFTEESNVLSFSQERLWFVDRYEGGTNAYNIPIICRLSNNVNIEVLEKAIRGIVNRHEVLRTIIKENDQGNAQQLVQDDVQISLQVTKEVFYHKNDLEQEIANLANHIFDLSCEYPIKIGVYNILKDQTDNSYSDNAENYLCILVHHIAFDGWSKEIFLKELQVFYNYYLLALQGLEVDLSLPPLSIQYNDYSLWQRSYLNKEKVRDFVIYWKNKLKDYENLNLPTDAPRPLEIDYNGRDIDFELDEATSTSLRQLARKLGVSLFSVLLSAYYLMLRVYSNQDDLVVGTPIANRDNKQIQNLIGFFINSLVIRIKINNNLTIEEFIQLTAKEVIEAQINHELPFERIVEELCQTKDPSRHPIFQVLFSVQSFSNEDYSCLADNSKIEVCNFNNIITNKAKFDLSVYIDDSQSCLKGCFNYATSLFNESTIRNYIEAYIQILKQFAQLSIGTQDQSALKVSDISYLNEHQFKKIVCEWNSNQLNFTSNKTIHELFKSQVEKTPNNIAITFQGKNFTYKELDQISNQLAHYLINSYRIKAEELLILCLDRNEQILISILAILKAGGAYVPIDPTYPKDRIEYIIHDTKASIIITNEKFQDKFPFNSSNQVILIDNEEIREKISIQDKSFPLVDIPSNNLAYVIYTSGTTGKPKGVLQTHSNVLRLFTATDKWYGFNDKEVWTLFHSFVFDFSVWEMWGALIYGGKLVIPSYDETRDFELFYELCKKEKVTVLNLTPSAFYQFSDIAANKKANDQLECLKYIIFGGEALKLSQLKSWFIKYGYVKPRLINMYGITETTVHVTYKLIEKDELEYNNNIGHVIPDLTAYVLDNNLQPLPIGAIGELYIGGAGVARGYLNRHDLTAERFVTNPFQSDEEKRAGKNARLYKTGDLVRWLPDGNLEYIGRNDFQVKIRGYRIELGEIEAGLTSYPGIKQSVVIVKEPTESNGEAQGSKYLVGYYVAEEDIDEEHLRKYLAAKLPEYMVPAILIALDKMPLTINGKIDRKALPEPILSKQDNYVAPRNELEKELCAIWGEVLGIEPDKISIQDDFFRLGGDSIISIQLVSRIRRRLGLSVSVKDIFNFKSIEKLYDNVLSKTVSEEVTLNSEHGILDGTVPLLPIQEWFFANKFEKFNHWNQAFIVKVPDLDIEKLKTSLEKLIEHHDAFRLRYRKLGDGNYEQYYASKAQAESLMTLDISQLNTQESTEEFNIQLQQILTDWQSNFDIEKGPLYSIGYIHGYKDGSARLWFALHHLIIDTVSWRIITEDLKRLYNEEELGAKSSSYRQWANAIKEYANQHKEETTYWNNITSDYNSSILERLVKDGYRSYAALELSENYTKKLLRESNYTYNTQVNDILLTALGLTLSELLGNKINHILLEGHGRENNDNKLDISRTVGWFTSMYPVRLEVQEDIGNTIKAVKESLRQIPNKGIGYGALLGYKPDILPKIAFNYLGQLDLENRNSAWSILSESGGLAINQNNHDNNIININGSVTNEKLKFEVVSKLDSATTLEIAQKFKSNLEGVISYTINQSRHYLTSSDVNNIISQEYLDNLQQEKEIEAVYLANSLQQGFIYHALNQGEIDDAYLVQLLFHYHTSIKVDELKSAWKYAQNRFEALRLRLAWQDELVQIIDKEGSLDWRYIDLSQEDQHGREEAVKNIQAKDRKEPYLLDKGCLFRIYIIKQRTNLYTCLLSFHHAILDGWSYPIILGYVHEVYTKLLIGEKVVLYIDKSYQEVQKYLQENKFSNHNYWKNYISQIENKPDLSSLLIENSKYRNIKLSEYRYITQFTEKTLEIKGALYNNLKNLSYREGVTINVILQYVWHKILSIYGNSNQSIVGTTISGRNLPIDNIESSVGLFINTLPLILDHQASNDKSIIEILKGLQEDINELNIRSNVNLADLQHHGERLFDTLFVYENFPSHNNELNAKLKIEIEGMTDKIDYPISVTAYEDSKQIKFILRYAGELFSDNTINKLFLLTENILQQLIQSYNKPASQLRCLPEAQYNELISKWNATDKEFEQELVVPELFAKVAQEYPNNIAVRYGDISITYKELNERSNQLANYLRNIGVDRGTLVVLVLERSIEMIISILGILKTGGAYIPLDPTYSTERIQFVINDSKAKFILTNEENKGNIQNLDISLISTQIIRDLGVDKSPSSLILNSITNTNFNDLAYIIYTSGTTGTPKGVMIEHQSLVNYINNVKEHGLIACNDRVDFSTNIGFDLTVTTTIAALCIGAEVAIYSGQLQDLDCYKQHLIKNNVNVVKLVPSYFELLIDDLASTSVNKIILGGEKINNNLLQRLDDIVENNKNLSELKLYDEYGPTETTVGACIKEVYPEGNLDIGKPYYNYKAYVLDSNLQPLPIGAIGELYIGGAGVARGYLNRADLTKERFIANPFQSEEEKRAGKNARLYKTGDLVRWLPDSNLEYIGRNDFQVKIRGYRIELGEIEAGLTSYPGIKQSVIIVKEPTESNGEAQGSKYLVGYYVAEEDIDEEHLRKYLAAKLPEYMVPAILIALDKMPLTINGKIDRKALPEPILSKQDNYVAPRNELEKELCAIWGEVLGIEPDKISIQDDFFRLGGDSIISIQLVSRIRRKLGLNITVKDIFNFKSIERLYDNVLSKSSDEETELNIEHGVLEGEVPLLPIQEWFFANKFEKPNHWNQAFIVKIPTLDIERLKNSLEKLITHHDAFRLRYRKLADGNYEQYYDSNVQAESLNILDLSKLSVQEGTEEFRLQLQQILTSWQSNFDIEKGPLYSVGYIYCYKDGSARLWFALHHLIIDTVSWRIITEDLNRLYNEEELGAKSSSYRQWANAIKEYAHQHSEEANYWAKITVDHDNKALEQLVNNNTECNYVELGLSEEYTKKLLRESNNAYNTQVNDILLTALGFTLSELLGNKINHILLEGHGRENNDNKLDISRTVGWFTSMYPVRLEVQNDIGSSIKAVKESLREIPNKGIGYGAFKGYQPNILPKIVFNYLGQLDAAALTVSKNNFWNITEEESGIQVDQENHIFNIININCLVINGALKFKIGTKLDNDTTNNLAITLQEKLKYIIDYTSIQTKSFLTRSDIDNIISQEYLDILQQEKEIEAVYLANSLQQGFIYHALNQGEIDDAYLVQLIWDYYDSIDIKKLKLAWEYAQKKFGALRLRLAWQDELVQIIDKEGSLDWRYIDLSQEDQHTCEEAIKNIQAKDRKEPYSLDKGCLFRIYIIKQKANLYTCLFSSHHAILDGWSTAVLVSYIHGTYINLNEGRKISLYVDKSYQDVQKYLQENKFSNHNYWKSYISQIENKPDLSSLLIDNKEFRSINVTTYKRIINHKEQTLIIKDNLYHTLKELTYKEGVTINVILQYAWHKVLSIYGNSTQTIVGTTVSGRNLPVDNIESSVGLFINTLPLILDHQASNNKSIIEILKGLQEDINELSIRSNVNLADLQHRGERLFDTLFVYENYPAQTIEIPGKLNIEFKEVIEKLDYPLGVTAYEDGDQIKFLFRYAGELFSDNTINKLFLLTENILQQLIQNYNKPASQLRCLPEAQYNELISKWNATDKEFEQELVVPELFARVAQEYPNNIAVRYGDISITYKELNERSNQLANYLRNIGVDRGTLVVLVLERSIEMIISILGILKTGGAYIPLDPTYSTERIQFVINDSKAKFILTNEENKGNIQNLDISLISTQIIRDLGVDKSPSSLILNSITNTNFNDLAYIIYTSGTTGTPKGVMIEHQSLVNYINNVKEHGLIACNDRVDFSTNIGFDLTVTTTIAALCIGAEVAIYSGQLQDLDCYKQHLIKNNVNVVKLVPSYFELLIDDLASTSVNKIILGGEKINNNLLQRLDDIVENNKNLSELKLYDEYGPTETTVGACIKEVYPEGNLDIGKPYYNYKAYVLDSNLQPLPIGAIGELYIGGAGVARGYLNRADLTKERFIANPFQSEEEKRAGKNARLYKTGDLVRWLPDSNLEYIGRNDFQVKIRGYRIELGEIEAGLTSYPGIKQSVIIVKEPTESNGEAQGSKYLVGYYVAEEDIDEEHLRKYLADKLPEYMVPAILIALDKMPLTINGKIDRKALPEPILSKQDNYVAPRNELEKELCAIWGEVLGIEPEKISIHDDFFKLGGNSIMAIKLVTKVNKLYNFYVKIADIFIDRCIAALVPKINKMQYNYQSIILLNNAPNKQKMFMVHPGKSGCEVYSSLAKRLSSHFSCYGIDSYNLYHEQKIRDLNLLAEYYLSEMDKILTETQEKYFLLGWSLGGKIALEIARLLEKRHPVKEINVCLLNTMLIDNNLIELSKDIDDEIIKDDYRKYYTRQGFEPSYIERMISNITVENKLGKQENFSVLKKTKVLLFKAMLKDSIINRPPFEDIYRYSLTLDYNNIDKIVLNQSHIKVIKVNNAHHNNLLNQEEVLVSELNNWYNLSSNTNAEKLELLEHTV
ncbi:non-ribosomal peptide synthetase [Rickettsiales endosymbiont of Stachyamoeba lipophora]|uniref:non-ribosomal peptide synthetase n=1 Tax=Rickettsiales endosymbiont of Stachyamoeba lipophora TaxID=2486578 RepID=UPI0013DE1AF1|nr:non-ribosomal peptide synthetase [Rickettsiales endosymbiont of Stachyamoeba lipophora]